MKGMWSLTYKINEGAGNVTGGRISIRRINNCTWYYPIAWRSLGGPPLHCKYPDTKRMRSLEKAKQWIEKTTKSLIKEIQ